MAEATPKPFKYPFINSSERQIRLIHIQPGEGNDMIWCTLETVSLEDKPRYEALSYEWGKPDTTGRQIRIGNNVFAVRENLYWALCRLRREVGPRTFWVDALCINQEDTKERNHQVAQMGNIYSQAFRVVAWIGEPREKHLYRDRTAKAIGFIYKLSNASMDEYPPYLKYDGRVRRNTVHEIEWKALCKLCMKGYWYRLWIVQELVLASDLEVQYGALIFPWQIFKKIFRHLRGYWGLGQSPLIDRIVDSLPCKIDERRNGRLRTPKDPSQGSLLLDLLGQFSRSSCLDIRDRVFGLLNLSRACCRRAVPVDYSMTILEICVQILEHHLVGHDSKNGGENVAAVHTILRVFELEVHAPVETSQVYRDFSFCGFIPRRVGKLPLHVTHCGKIVFIRPLKSLVIPYTQRGDLGNVGSVVPPSKAVQISSLLSFDAFGSFINAEHGICYLNPRSDHTCNSITSSKTRLDESKITITFRLYLAWFHFRIVTKRMVSQLIAILPMYIQDCLRSLKSVAAYIGDGQQFPENASHFANSEEKFWTYIRHQHRNIWRQDPQTFVEQHQETLDRISKWKDLDLHIFLTSTGILGTATRNVKLRDRVYKTRHGDRRLAILSRVSDFTQVSGKGLEIISDVSFPDMYKENGGMKSLEVDMATLLFLSGYF
ncbi:hypothetical protein GLAREA_08080 [Glarea lozoyensis ATCC 20868]|uniref:Heterokaryon incompatibility domain-containing protein n=1 Tax=Glarea lozoyensis (strain ATCC 20868 / MF5171) TaxID=1116229 RepID=S3CDY6_GLAL2|nr:uncharacterized protein GLAREA_08080 [Glarea lozoyensis ATCC 20868]EPE24230.1 hypothetical protein GLAREA_08080 [Glarea lozoyensis ATCC 20868]